MSSQRHSSQNYSDNDSNISPVKSDDEEISNNSSTSSVQNVRGKRGRGSRAPRATTRARGRGKGQTTLNF